jgi:hypothetical protein
MNLVLRWRGWRSYAEATVAVVDGSGNPVEGAIVSGHWAGATSDADSGTTGYLSTVTLQSDVIWRPSPGTTFTFIVDNVVKDGCTYDAGSSIRSGSVTVPP